MRTPGFVVSADLNHDGKADLVVANGGDNSVGALLGNGDGTFQPEQGFVVGSSPKFVAVADLNGDGKPDLAVANNFDTTISVLLGKGDGTFNAQQAYTVGGDPGAVAVADFNGDGKLDLVVPNENELFASVLFGNGDGTFQPQTKLSLQGDQANNVVVADFNADSKPDIAFYDNAGVAILLSNGDGTFQSLLLVAIGAGANGIAVADFNADGRADLVGPDISHNNLVERLGNANSQIQFSGTPPISTTESGTVTYTVTRTGSSDGAISAFVNATGGTATVGQDYTLLQPLPLTWADKDATSKTVSIPIVPDQLDEDDETAQFTVSLAPGASWGAIGTQGSTTLTIADDDPQPFLSVANASLPEGNSGSSSMTFPVTLTGPSGRTVTVQYATADDTAQAGSDYTATSGTLTFAPGETSKTVAVPVLGDTNAEQDESFTVTLSNPANAPLSSAQAIGIIRNDDAGSTSTINIAPVSAPEGNSGTSIMAFPVTLASPNAQTVSVQYATADATAQDTSDYAATHGTLTFAPGETAKAIGVPVAGDTTPEQDETFTVTLSDPVNATIGQGQATGTIQNDDVAAACSPRPSVVSSVTAGGAALQVHVEPTAYEH